MRHIQKIIFTIFFLSAGLMVLGQDLVYRPINPAFGGNYLNYSWLLSQAQAQNDFAEDPSASLYGQDPLATFQDDLNRQILNQLSRALVSDLFGEDGRLNEGQFEIGNYQIEVINGLNGVNIGILDILSGSNTTVTVPYY